MTMHLKFRTWNPSGLGSELPIPGEPFWDTSRSRLGIYNNRSPSVPVEWFPELRDDMFMNRSQRIGGRDSGDGYNPIRLDWSQAGKLRILNTLTNTVLAEFAEVTNTFHNASVVATGIPGMPNWITNAGLAVERSLIPALTEGYNSSLISLATPILLAPNWLFWRKTGSSGNATATISTDVPSGVGATKSAKLAATGAPTNLGIRHYIFDYKSLVGKTLNISAYHKGPSGSTARMRISTEAGGVLGTATTINGSGAWARANAVTLAIPDNGSKWLAFDSLYTPGYGSANAVDWYVAAPQISLTSTLMNFDARAADIDRALLRASYAEIYHAFNPSMNNFNFVPLHLIDSAGNPRVTYIPDNDATYTISAYPNRLNVASPTVTPTAVRILAYLAPVTTDTQ